MASRSTLQLTSADESAEPIDSREAADSHRAAASVSKALHILDCFSDVDHAMSLSELARRAELPKSTAFRLLAYLEEAGYVIRNAKMYRVGSKLFELGSRTNLCSTGGIRDIANPYLSDLHVRTGYVVHLAEMIGTDVMYLDKMQGHRSPTTPTRVGGRFNATCCALGKAMLANSDNLTVADALRTGLPKRTAYSIGEPGRLIRELQLIRHNGVAFDREEAALGLVCVAAPIMFQGSAVAAISVSGATTQFDPRAVAGLVQKSADRIAEQYGLTQRQAATA